MCVFISTIGTKRQNMFVSLEIDSKYIVVCTSLLNTTIPQRFGLRSFTNDEVNFQCQSLLSTMGVSLLIWYQIS